MDYNERARVLADALKHENFGLFQSEDDVIAAFGRECAAQAFEEAAKEARREGNAKGCMDCLSAEIIHDLFLDKAAALRAERKS